MTGVLIDTNVLSELTRKAPAEQVVDFVAKLETSFLSAITVQELRFGLELLPAGKRRNALAAMIDKLLSEYGDAIVGISRAEAAQAGILRAREAVAGRALHLADALIAATAMVHGLTLATRNVSDFAGLGIAVVNPWDE